MLRVCQIGLAGVNQLSTSNRTKTGNGVYICSIERCFWGEVEKERERQVHQCEEESSILFLPLVDICISCSLVELSLFLSEQREMAVSKMHIGLLWPKWTSRKGAVVEQLCLCTI